MENPEIINSINVKQLNEYINSCKVNPSLAERKPKLTAHWIGDEHSRIQYGDISLEMGDYDNGQVSPMVMLLASLAACDAGVIANHAALMGLKIESLSVEASGHFNILAFIGLKSDGGAGYDSVKLTFKLIAPEATTEQIAQLKELLKRSSPVGDSFTRNIPIELEFA